jgi:two-component system chemotaxis sensor kinase CheA
MGGVDPSMIAAFVDEADEALAEAERALLALLADAGGRTPVEAAFRALHSLKGDAALLGLAELKILAHASEDVLAVIRKGARRADTAVVELLLRGTRVLGGLVASIRSGVTDAAVDQEFQALLPLLDAARLEEAAESAWPELLQDLAEVASLADGNLATRLQELLVRMRRLAPGQTELSVDGHPPEQQLRALLTEPVVGQLDGSQAARIRAALDAFAAIVATPAAAAVARKMLEIHEAFIEAMGFTETLRVLLVEQLASLPVEATAAPSDSPQQAAAETVDQRPAGPSGAGKTMRVSERHVDGFLGHVGELIVVGHMFRHLQGRIEGQLRDVQLAHQLRQANETFHDLSSSLQRSIMSVRKVPLRSLLGKVPRIVHEVAQATGKRMRVQVLGEDLEVDKSLLELLDAPLVHLVRNAGDHGIETPGRRLAAGKPGEGLIRVSAEIISSQLRLEVADDGAGIDGGRVLATAARDGVSLPNLSGDALLLDLIMRPGLSTAAVVTDISGRGVGMDVVRHRIREAGGTITLNNRPGIGAAFIITLPTAVTTQIISGLVIEAAGSHWVLPAERVRESVALARLPRTQPPRGLPLLTHGGATLPLLRLDDLVGRAARHPPEVGVVLDAQAGLVVLGVGAIIGLQTLVLRPIDGLVHDGLVQGGALLGDGSVALVLDPDRLHTQAVAAMEPI